MTNKEKIEFIKKTVQLSWEEVTPEFATEKLDSMNKRIENGKHIQRNRIERNVARMAADMKSGAFIPTPQSIAFNVNGDLIDGQNRLWAVKNSGVSSVMLVTRGWPVSWPWATRVRLIDAIDRGVVRSIAMQFKINGRQYPLQEAAVALSLARMAMSDSQITLSTYQAGYICDLFKPNIAQLFNQSNRKSNLKAHVMAPLVTYHSFNPEKAAEFAHKFYTLEHLDIQSPVLAMVNYERNNPCVGGADRLRLMKAVATCIQKFDKGETTKIARPSEEALDWLLFSSAKNMRKIRELLAN